MRRDIEYVYCLTLKAPEKWQLYGLYVCFCGAYCNFGMLWVNLTLMTETETRGGGGNKPEVQITK